MLNSITQDQIIAFIFNEVKEEERKKIINAINTDEITKELYHSEKRKCDAERYLDNEMSANERIELEKLLAKDPSLNGYFIMSKKINLFLGLKSLRKQLNNIHIELYGSKLVKVVDTIGIELSSIKKNLHVKKLKPQIMQIGKWVAAASIVIALLSTGLFRIITGRSDFENRSYNEFYKSPITNGNIYFFRSSDFNKAKELYYKKDYEGALAILENLSYSKTTDSEILLFSGLTLMELERHEDAIKKFEDLLNENEELQVIRSITHWYLGLCYVKTHQNTKAVEQFEIIVKYKGYNHKEANKILKNLKKLQE